MNTSDKEIPKYSSMQFLLGSNSNGSIYMFIDFGHSDTIIYFEKSIFFNNMLRKWNRLCVTFQFKENKMNATLNGLYLKTYNDEKSNIPKIDFSTITDASHGAQIFFKLGRQVFDLNPMIGLLANIHVWDRDMDLNGI